MRIVIPSNEAIKADLDQLGRKAKFASAAGLNILANHAQEAIRDRVRGGKFTLRRPSFILNTIKRERGQDFARGSKLEAAVRIDPSRDFLAKFVEGGVKRPLNGGGSLLVPVGIKGTGKGGVVTAGQREKLRADRRVERIRSANGKDLIVRYSGRGKRGRVDVLYRLVRAVPIAPLLPIYRLAKHAVDRNWFKAMGDGVMEEMLQTLNRRHRQSAGRK